MHIITTRMYKILRVVLALASIAAMTLLFADFTGYAAAHWPWLAKLQVVPALLAANVVALAIIVALTLVLGRVYCSVLCPLGILQDAANWLRVRIMSKKAGKYRFRYSPAKAKTRWAVFGVFAVLLALGLANVLAASIAGLADPYSAYGRIAAQVFAPIGYFCNNLLASWSEGQAGNYDFARVAYAVSAPVLVVAIVSLVVVCVMAWRGGRDYCNTICPVGTLLGYISKYSLLKIRIDTEKCRNCGLCARACKAKCIDAKAHAVDATRCVACMDCLGTCSEGAISYTWRRVRKPSASPAPKASVPDAGRRGFMVAAGALAGATAMQAARRDGGLTALKAKQPARRAVAVVPAGAVSLEHLRSHCTACQLCIQNCPSHVLKPQTTLEGFMQPTLDYTNGFCRPECTLCSQICPAGAIQPIDEVAKSSIKVGTAVVDVETCLSASQGEKCGSCARHCPAGAIEMVEGENGNLRPAVNEEVCIGCGACEYYCPVGTVASMKAPGSAIHVEGAERHREI